MRRECDEVYDNQSIPLVGGAAAVLHLTGEPIAASPPRDPAALKHPPVLFDALLTLPDRGTHLLFGHLIFINWGPRDPTVQPVLQLSPDHAIDFEFWDDAALQFVAPRAPSGPIDLRAIRVEIGAS